MLLVKLLKKIKYYVYVHCNVNKTLICDEGGKQIRHTHTQSEALTSVKPRMRDLIRLGGKQGVRQSYYRLMMQAGCGDG